MRAVLSSLLASLGLLTNCKKVCDNEDAPTYAPTQGESEWSKAFVKNDVWRFRNAKGYVRTYRVSRAETLSEGGGGGKGSFCSTYFVKFFAADLERVDTCHLSQHMMEASSTTARKQAAVLS